MVLGLVLADAVPKDHCVSVSMFILIVLFDGVLDVSVLEPEPPAWVCGEARRLVQPMRHRR